MKLARVFLTVMPPFIITLVLWFGVTAVLTAIGVHPANEISKKSFWGLFWTTMSWWTGGIAVGGWLIAGACTVYDHRNQWLNAWDRQLKERAIAKEKEKEKQRLEREIDQLLNEPRPTVEHKR